MFSQLGKDRNNAAPKCTNYRQVGTKTRHIDTQTGKHVDTQVERLIHRLTKSQEGREKYTPN